MPILNGCEKKEIKPEVTISGEVIKQDFVEGEIVVGVFGKRKKRYQLWR